MLEQTPVVTSVQEEQVKTFEDFVGNLRADNVAVARDEVQRLTPYFTALSRQMETDKTLSPEKAAAAENLTSTETLCAIFNAVAARTKNTIISQILVAPEALLKQEAATKDCKQFNAHLKYGELTFNFGFMQTFGETGSTTFPLLTLNDRIMDSIEPFQSRGMLEALQTVATAGNHDMLHHYTNTYLNSLISKTNIDGDLPDPATKVKDWIDQYFRPYNSDSAINSFESWLMLDHMRVRRILEEGPEGKALEDGCNKFFDELTRIGRDMSAQLPAEQVHEAVDYLGTMLLFTMMRYMPLDHPLLVHAIDRLQQADPGSAVLEAGREKFIEETNAFIKKEHKENRNSEPYTQKALDNYSAQGVKILTENPGYADLKKLQLIQISPWIVHLLSPAPPESPLAKMKSDERLSSANLDMINTSAAGIWFDHADGQHSFVKPDGTQLEIWLKDGQYHREDGPAYTSVYTNGTRKEHWYNDGRSIKAPEKPAPQVVVVAEVATEAAQAPAHKKRFSLRRNKAEEAKP